MSGISYDANGNILKYLRKGHSATPHMDSLTYQYNYSSGKLINNRLNHVSDSIPAGNYSEDIDDQDAGNYQYDYIGNLKADGAEKIDTIRWTVYGKINRIVKSEDNVSIDYSYDAAGNRTRKRVNNNDTISITWYVRDAQGNVMAVYSNKEGTEDIIWKEQHLYGSSRLGMWRADTTVPAAPPVVDEDPVYDSVMLGSRTYELANHLGNVLATISDKKIGNDSSGVVNYYIAEVLSQTDYYPGGMLMPGRKYSATTGYRYGFNGKENDNEVKGEGNQQDYGMRIYDPRLVRFLSVDPLTKNYPWYTPYQFAGNKTIWAVDLDGEEEAYRNAIQYQTKQTLLSLHKARFQNSIHIEKPSVGEKIYSFFNSPNNQAQFTSSGAGAAAKFLFQLADDIKVLGTSFASNGTDSRHIGGRKATFDERMGSFINVSTTSIGIGETMAARDVSFGGNIVKQGEFVEAAFNKSRPGNVIGGEGLGNFKTFDDFENGIATSFKSVDMSLEGVLNNPQSITSKLNSYTNKITSFDGYKLKGVEITPADITTSNLKVGILGTPNSAQKAALNSATNYAQSQGVGIQLKMLRNPVDPKNMLRSGIIYSSNNIVGKKY